MAVPGNVKIRIINLKTHTASVSTMKLNIASKFPLHVLTSYVFYKQAFSSYQKKAIKSYYCKLLLIDKEQALTCPAFQDFTSVCVGLSLGLHCFVLARFSILHSLLIIFVIKDFTNFSRRLRYLQNSNMSQLQSLLSTIRQLLQLMSYL